VLARHRPADQVSRPSLETLAIHGGLSPDPTTGAVMTPIYQTSVFAFEAPGVSTGYEYSRVKNPTRSALEANLASLEGAKYGHAFASGVAAMAAVLQTLKPGDHVIACEDLYGGTWRLFHQVFSSLGIAVTQVGLSVGADIDAAIGAAKTPTTRFVWIESPTNPLLKIVDIAAVAAATHAHGLKLVVDNTFPSPYLTRPLPLGADVVVHSLTKYLGGHSDVVGGAVLTDDEELSRTLAFLQKSYGTVPGPFDSFLVLRGTKTLHVRMDRHCLNAQMLAETLLTHKAVSRVLYPGLPEHPGHEVAKRQMSGRFGAVVCIEVAGGRARAEAVLGKTKLFTLAESLGGVESLIGHPWTMSHGALPEAAKVAAGIPENLLRLSVGIENVYDLWEDLDQALGA